MKKIIVLKIIFICFYMNALAEVPNSIKKLENKYMNNYEYLYSIGEGKTSKEAKINAYINMADKYFYIGFKTESIFLEQYKEKNMNIAYMPFLEENSNLQNYAEIFNIEFLEEEYDDKEKKYYVFSAANKVQLYSILKNKILKNESSIEVYNEHLSFEEDHLNKFMYLEIIYILSRKNYVYNKQIEVMNFECLNLNYKYDDFLYRLKETEKQLTFAISANTGIEINKEIMDLLFYDVNKYGLNGVSSSNANYIFKLNIILNPVENRTINKIKYIMQFTLSISRNDEIIHTFKFKDDKANYKKIGISDLRKAQDQARYNTAKILKEEFSIQLKEFFDKKIKNL